MSKIALHTPTEHEEQVEFVRWFRRNYDETIMAIPNGANKSRSSAANFKAEGLLSGAPDLFVASAKRGYHGLLIEMKRTKGSSTTAQQKKVIADLNSAGYYACVCKGAEAAKKTARWYFTLQ